MMVKKAVGVYFSPHGTTKKTADQIVGHWEETKSYDLLRNPLREMTEVEADAFLVAAMPVYAGRIPGVCREMLMHLKGNQTPAAVVAVYGNREYEDALLELRDLLQQQGFQVVAAAAFVAEHSIFPKVASGRPDEKDLEQMDAFAVTCMEKESMFREKGEGRLLVKGNMPYREPKKVPLTPHARKNCIACGACARICPVQAIDKKRPDKTDDKKCISCGACIAVCPEQARTFSGPVYSVAAMKFAKDYSAYKKPELFYMEWDEG